MRILHIVGTISPAAGGPTEVIRMLVRHAPAGYVSEVATLDDPSAPFLAELPFPVHALGTARKRWYVPRFSQWLAANCSRFDGVVVHGLWEYTGVAAHRTLGRRVPYVVFPHGMLDPYFKRAHPAKHAKKWLYWLLAEYWVLRGAFRILFTTAAERDLARQSFRPAHWQPMVVALGAEPQPADTPALQSAFEGRCPALAGKRFLLFLGRIDPKKGCDLLIEAFTAAADPELHLVMAGPDSANWSAALRARAEATGCGERVHWPGMLRGEAKYGALAACEAFILPSHQENFGIAVVEALAAGRPVLISDQVNIAPNIATDGCGLVEPDSREGVCRLLARWLALSSEDRIAMSHRALETFATRYDMRRNAEAILRVFEQVPAMAPANALTEAR